MSTYGTESFLMTWDPSGASWAHFNVTGQPAAILFEPDGTVIEGWFGPFPEGDVLELAEQAG